MLSLGTWDRKALAPPSSGPAHLSEGWTGGCLAAGVRVLDNLSQPGQSTMPAQAVVTLRYGPYSAVGLSVEHRTYRLQGLQGGPPH